MWVGHLFQVMYTLNPQTTGLFSVALNPQGGGGLFGTPPMNFASSQPIKMIVVCVDRYGTTLLRNKIFSIFLQNCCYGNRQRVSREIMDSQSSDWTIQKLKFLMEVRSRFYCCIMLAYMTVVYHKNLVTLPPLVKIWWPKNLQKWPKGRNDVFRGVRSRIFHASICENSKFFFFQKCPKQKVLQLEKN